VEFGHILWDQLGHLRETQTWEIPHSCHFKGEHDDQASNLEGDALFADKAT